MNEEVIKERAMYCFGEFCRVGGWRSSAPLEPNYGLPCVTGWNAETGQMTSNCWFCGRRARDSGRGIKMTPDEAMEYAANLADDLPEPARTWMRVQYDELKRQRDYSMMKLSEMRAKGLLK